MIAINQENVDVLNEIDFLEGIDINSLFISDINVDSLPDLSNLSDQLLIITVLRCNALTTLPLLPENLQRLVCVDNNNLTLLPVLPPNLTNLDCNNNKLTSLPELPATLTVLACGNNNITTWPELPPNLDVLDCDNNNLRTLPELPPNLEQLNCDSNQLRSLPLLPPNLQELYCFDNPLISLTNLPNSISNLRIDVGILDEPSFQMVCDLVDSYRGDISFREENEELIQNVEEEKIERIERKKRDIRNRRAATGVGGLLPEEHNRVIADKRPSKLMYKYDPLTPGFAKTMGEVDKYLNQSDAGQRMLATGTEGLKKEEHTKYIENTRATGKKTPKDQSDGAFPYVNALIGEYLGKPIDRGGRKKSRKSKKSKKRKSRKNKK